MKRKECVCVSYSFREDESLIKVGMGFPHLPISLSLMHSHTWHMYRSVVSPGHLGRLGLSAGLFKHPKNRDISVSLDMVFKWGAYIVHLMKLALFPSSWASCDVPEPHVANRQRLMICHCHAAGTSWVSPWMGFSRVCAKSFFAFFPGHWMVTCYRELENGASLSDILLSLQPSPSSPAFW